MKRAAVLVALVLLAGVAPSDAAEKSLRDEENPRNVRWDGRVILYLSAAASDRGEAVLRMPPWPDRAEVRWVMSAYDSRTLRGPRPWPQGKWTADGTPLRTTLGPGHPIPFALWTALPGRHEITASWGDESCSVASDALRVALWIERETAAAGDARFGSFTRRFRKSLEDLHALFERSRWPLAPSGIEERFRIETSEVFDRARGESPSGYADHPHADVAVVCEEGGPLAGFSLPEYSIGHDFTGPAEHRGLWSSWGEQALWHELLHFRGVQDFYVYEVPDGGLPGRWKGVLPLPKRYAKDLMCSPYQEPFLGEYAAVVANSKRGIARVGACEDPDHEHGHMWRWLPERIDLGLVKAGKPLAGAAVRWWRSRAIAGAPGARDPRTQGVAAGRPPDGSATSDEEGRVSIGGDYLGRRNPREDRSLWLLVEVESGGTTRFELLYGLDANLAYARGDTAAWAPVLDFARLLAPNGTVPSGR